MFKKIFQFATISLCVGSLLVTGCGIHIPEPEDKSIDFPTRPINVIVPFSAGGGGDLQIRALEKLAPKYLNQNFIVQNKTGGGGSIGLNELVTSPPMAIQSDLVLQV